MPILLPSQNIVLSAAQRKLVLPLPALDPQTAAIELRLPRDMTGRTVDWDAASRLAVRIILMVNGEEYVAAGSAAGGIRFQQAMGVEHAEYVLRYSLPCGFFGARSGMPKRLGERGIVVGHVEIERVSGRAETAIQVESLIAPAPQIVFRSSVAFDANTSAQESAGDGVLSLSHTASGSDRAAFAGVVWNAGTGQSSTSCTYDGVGMTEMWDLNAGSFYYGAGYRLAGPGTGALTVTSTVSDADAQALGVITMTGVDQTTPVGTPVSTTLASGTSISVTVGSVGSDDLLCDSLSGQPGTLTPTIGADQTLRNTESGFGSILRDSTQPGTAANGDMSWSWAGQGNRAAILGAVAFKPAAGGGAALVHRGLLLGIGI